MTSRLDALGPGRRPIRIIGAYNSGYADRIIRLQDGGEIWQGGYPIDGEGLRRHGVEVLVLCAEELQPKSREEALMLFPRVDVVFAPMDDDGKTGPTRDEAKIAALAAHKVVGAMLLGKRVLVTCAMGRNRSGLVTALALIILGMAGREAIERVKTRRVPSLTNESFCRFLESVKR